jgi:hypothetical protein
LNPKSQREQPTTENGINLVAASKTLLRVVADWAQNEYTEANIIRTNGCPLFSLPAPQKKRTGLMSTNSKHVIFLADGQNLGILKRKF